MKLLFSGHLSPLQICIIVDPPEPTQSSPRFVICCAKMRFFLFVTGHRRVKSAVSSKVHSVMACRFLLHMNLPVMAYTFGLFRVTSQTDVLLSDFLRRDHGFRPQTTDRRLNHGVTRLFPRCLTVSPTPCQQNRASTAIFPDSSLTDSAAATRGKLLPLLGGPAHSLTRPNGCDPK